MMTGQALPPLTARIWVVGLTLNSIFSPNDNRKETKYETFLNVLLLRNKLKHDQSMIG